MKAREYFQSSDPCKRVVWELSPKVLDAEALLGKYGVPRYAEGNPLWAYYVLLSQAVNTITFWWGFWSSVGRCSGCAGLCPEVAAICAVVQEANETIRAAGDYSVDSVEMPV